MHEKYSNWHHLVVASATSYSNHTTDEWGYFRGIVAGRIIQKHISLIANTSVHPAPYPSIILLAWSRMWISWDLPLNIISELCGNHGNVTWEAANRMALKGGQKWNDTARWITSWHCGLWGALFWCDSHTSVLRGVNYREAHTARGKKTPAKIFVCVTMEKEDWRKKVLCLFAVGSDENADGYLYPHTDRYFCPANASRWCPGLCKAYSAPSWQCRQE